MGSERGGSGKAGAELAAPVAVSCNPHAGVLRVFQRNQSFNLVSFWRTWLLTGSSDEIKWSRQSVNLSDAFQFEN